MAGEHLEQADVVLVELADTELGDDDDAAHARAVFQRHGDDRLVDVVRARNRDGEVAVHGVLEQEGAAGLGNPAGEAFPELAGEILGALLRVLAERALEGDREEGVAVGDVDPAVVVVDQAAELVHDHGADLAHVVQAVQAAGEALQHLQVGDGTDVLAPAHAFGTLRRRVVEEDALVLAPGLGGHHRGLGAGDQLARVHRVLGPLRNADGEREPARGVELPVCELVGEARGEPQSVARVAGGHDDPELLAAEPADDVRGPHGLAEDVGERDENLVAGAVPVDVVDALEVVDVEHEDGDRVVRPADPVELGAQAVVEVAVVVEAGE